MPATSDEPANDERRQSLVRVGQRRPLLSTLPSPVTPIVGRDGAVADVAALLVRPEVRLVTLTGPGGVGKTRLALAAAADLEPVFPDGAVYVDLIPVAEPQLVAGAIARAHGVREDGDEDRVETLRRFLREREMLLLLDNFEQVLTAAPLLSNLLAACPGLTVLVTSRTVLRLSGEHAYPVPPLALPEQAGRNQSLSATEAAKAPAVGLFVARAAAVKPGFVLDDANASTIVEICRRLDGLPLAVELAAARIAVFPPAALLKRLERRLPVLAGGPRNLPARQQTMRDAIAWSYGLLSPHEQALFRRLAMFTGGCTLEAAEAVATPTAASSALDVEVAEIDAMDGVIALVEQSLLHQREDPDGEPRYLMLETIREFGLEQLAANGEEDDTRRARAQYFLSVIERTADGSDASENRLEADHDNLRGALAWTLEHDPEAALRLAAGLWRFWDRRGHWSEGRSWLERALASGSDVAPANRAPALAGLAMLASHQADFALARRCHEECRAIWADLGDGQGVIRSLRGLGIVASNQNQLDQARALFDEALAAARIQGDRPAITNILGDLGLVANRRGDHADAAAYLEEALSGDIAVDEWTAAIHQSNLGVAYWGLGDRERAAAIFEAALAVSRRLGDQYGVAVNQLNVADFANDRGRFNEAAERLLETVTIARDLGEVRLANRALDGLAIVATSSRRPDLAARLFGAAAAVRDAANDTLDATEEATRLPPLTLVREQLGDAAWAAAWGVGQALTLEEAIAEAASSLTSSTTADARRAATADALLTTREAEVLRLLAEGRSDKEIAETLYVTRATASKHVSNILAKLEVDSRGAAAAFALRERLI